MKQGKIIVLEGVDGAGKTTQKELLEDFLNLEENIKKYGKTIFLKEPGSTKAGLEIREVILNNNLDPITESMLFYSARNELIKNKINGEIKKGNNVIIDRFELATFAYQVYGKQREDIMDFIKFLSKNIVPENFVYKYYFFDLNIEIAKKRSEQRNKESDINDKYDKKGEDFFNRVRKGYLKEIKNFPYEIIDASKTIEEVKKEFFNKILKDLEK